LKTPSSLLAGLAFCLVCIASGPVRAQAVVTACGTDVASGGMNLRSAVASGGKITFECGAAAAQIAISAPLTVTAPTQVDGDKKITLVGPAGGPMFNNSSTLTLSRITVLNSAPGGTGIIRGRQGEVVLHDVRTAGTSNAYVALTLRADASIFSGNGVKGGGAGVIIDAERIQLARVVFNRNVDHPVGGGDCRPLGASRLVVHLR